MMAAQCPSSDELPLLSPPALRSGRPRDSAVWDYFFFDPNRGNLGKSVCQVQVKITRKLAVFVGAGHVANRTVECEEFSGQGRYSKHTRI